MSKKHIETVIKDLKDGRMIILVDDKDRENEGDIVVAAEYATPQNINFMARYARGLICLAMDPDLVNHLNLPLMTGNNQAPFRTNFTVSIDARYGITTGISAYDRAKTILDCVSDKVMPYDLVVPGHIFPLKANPHGILGRNGQTEGSVDLTKLAGLKPAAVICEIMNNDGTMARRKDLEKFSKKHNIKIVHIKDLIQYRLSYDASILIRVSKTRLPTEFGEFEVVAYESTFDGNTHLALIKNENLGNKVPLVRVHSECMTGDVFGSLRCDCGDQLYNAMKRISEEKNGLIVYLRQEGRGIGLANKIRAYSAQDKGMDTVEANRYLGFKEDLRDYGIAAQILSDLGFNKIRLLTNNPRKVLSLNYGGIDVVERISLETKTNELNLKYLTTKKNKLGHLLNLNSGRDLSRSH